MSDRGSLWAWFTICMFLFIEIVANWLLVDFCRNVHCWFLIDIGVDLILNKMFMWNCDYLNYQSQCEPGVPWCAGGSDGRRYGILVSTLHLPECMCCGCQELSLWYPGKVNCQLKVNCQANMHIFICIISLFSHFFAIEMIQ